VPLRKLRRDVPRWFARVIDRALAHATRERYADGGELARALEAGDVKSSRRLALASVALAAPGLAVLGFALAGRAEPAAVRRHATAAGPDAGERPSEPGRAGLGVGRGQAPRRPRARPRPGRECSRRRSGSASQALELDPGIARRVAPARRRSL